MRLFVIALFAYYTVFITVTTIRQPYHFQLYVTGNIVPLTSNYTNIFLYFFIQQHYGNLLFSCELHLH